MASQPSVLDKVKMVFGSFGTLVGGGLIYWGPDGIAEEIPLHEPIGLAFIGVGVLMFLALFSARVRSFLKTLVVGIVSGAAIWTAWVGDSLPYWQRGLIGVLGVLALLYVFSCLIAVFTGKDPDNDILPNS